MNVEWDDLLGNELMMPMVKFLESTELEKRFPFVHKVLSPLYSHLTSDLSDIFSGFSEADSKWDDTSHELWDIIFEATELVPYPHQMPRIKDW